MNDSSDSTSGLVDPHKMAKRQQVLQGNIAVRVMQRANKLLANEHGQMLYTLDFANDVDGLCVIQGELSGELTLFCHRCMRPFIRNVSVNFTVSPVANDQAAKVLPEAYEPVIMCEGKIDTLELFEDELILALPIVAMHEVGDLNCTQTTAAAEQVAQEEENPFQILQTLKVNKKGHQAGDE
jgi:uncharacterized protein